MGRHVSALRITIVSRQNMIPDRIRMHDEYFACSAPILFEPLGNRMAATLLYRSAFKASSEQRPRSAFAVYLVSEARYARRVGVAPFRGKGAPPLWRFVFSNCADRECIICTSSLFAAKLAHLRSSQFPGIGRVNENVAPCPRCESTEIMPPWPSMMRLAIV